MEKSEQSQLAKGFFLIAAPDVQSGQFFRSVILICEHNPAGSFGLIINRALDIEIPEEVADIEEVMNPYVGMRTGGPVQPNQMMLLHTSDEIPDDTLDVCEGVFLGGDLDFLHKILADAQGPQVLLCFGYSGWGGGQLEREFLDGGWLLWPARKEHVFDVPPDKLWQTLLREMGGKYATLSMIPEDLTLN